MRCYDKSRISMLNYLTTLATIIAVCCTAANGNSIVRAEEDLVNVEFYYAALCIDSIRFVANQLIPAYEDIGNYINVTYIPYGKAIQQLYTNENGIKQWHFVCQHGVAGCYANKAQACAINEILTNPEISNEQQVLLNLVGCVMSASNPAVAVPKCLETIGIAANYISSVNYCIASTDGDELIAAHGDKTHALDPTIAFVPTIVINGVFSQKDTDNALVDFKGLVCQYISAENQPSVCRG